MPIGVYLNLAVYASDKPSALNIFPCRSYGFSCIYQHCRLPLVGHKNTVMDIAFGISVADKLSCKVSVFILRVIDGLKDISCDYIASLSGDVRNIAIPIIEIYLLCCVVVLIGCLIDVTEPATFRKLNLNTATTVKCGEYCYG